MYMPKGIQITFYEREKIEVWLRMKKKKTWIANKLDRNYSVIKREIKRNSGDHLPYTAAIAQRLADARARKTNVLKLEKPKNKELKKFIEEKIKDDWSPEQIVGYIEENDMNWECDSISHETIYDYVYNHSDKYKKLYKHLRVGRKKRQKRFYRKKQGNIIKNRVSIHDRPNKISEKKEFGHWETDLMEFKKGSPVLCVNYERSSMLCRVYKSRNKNSLLNENNLIKIIDEFSLNCKSFTRDNGSENVNHLDTLNEYDIPSYFCDVQCSWQKGGVENCNKLLRQYLPRNCNFESITEEELLVIQEKLNNRPRKNLNFLTPNQVSALKIKKGL